jgi:hypothetical protein
MALRATKTNEEPDCAAADASLGTRGFQPRPASEVPMFFRGAGITAGLEGAGPLHLALEILATLIVSFSIHR